jgi:hypothetical protein
MKLGLDDPRVPALRYRLTVTGDLAGDLQPPAPPLNLAFDRSSKPRSSASRSGTA